MPRDAGLYVEDMLEAVRRIQRYTHDTDEVSFRADPRSIDAVVHNLQVLGEAAKGVPSHIRDLAPEIDWRKIAGMRDFLVHSYFRVDLTIVWDAVTTKVPLLESPLGRLLATLDGEVSP